jgi:hypothetical protein
VERGDAMGAVAHKIIFSQHKTGLGAKNMADRESQNLFAWRIKYF